MQRLLNLIGASVAFKTFCPKLSHYLQKKYLQVCSCQTQLRQETKCLWWEICPSVRLSTVAFNGVPDFHGQLDPSVSLRAGRQHAVPQKGRQPCRGDGSQAFCWEIKFRLGDGVFRHEDVVHVRE